MSSSAKTIIYVPGMKPKPPVEIHRGNLWRALLEGARRINPDVADDIAGHFDRFKLAPWPHLFYPQPSDPSPDFPGLERLLSLPGPEPRDLKDARHWKKRLIRLLYLAVDSAPFLLKLIPAPQLKENIADSQRYLRNEDGMGERIRAHVAAEIEAASRRDDRILLIAHSLGSVIAWDVLWEFSRRSQQAISIDLLLTLGSPLGLNFMRSRLLGASAQGPSRYPSNIRRWCNLSAVGELTALDKTMADDYQEMLKMNLIESISDQTDLKTYFRGPDGLNVHKCYGYLINPCTAEIITNWWQKA